MLYLNRARLTQLTSGPPFVFECLDHSIEIRKGSSGLLICPAATRVGQRGERHLAGTDGGQTTGRSSTGHEALRQVDARAVKRRGRPRRLRARRAMCKGARATGRRRSPDPTQPITQPPPDAYAVIKSVEQPSTASAPIR
jgi:hypothetical protein